MTTFLSLLAMIIGCALLTWFLTYIDQKEDEKFKNYLEELEDLLKNR